MTKQSFIHNFRQDCVIIHTYTHILSHNLPHTNNIYRKMEMNTWHVFSIDAARHESGLYLNVI